MLSPQAHALIRSLQVKTFKALQSPLAGDYQTARKGIGVEFFQLREYQPGDDIRFIDWKSTLRSDRMMVKECVEQKQQTIVLIIDVSASSWYGSESVRFEWYQKIATILAYAAAYQHDRVALIAFAQGVELSINPQSGMQGVSRILDALFSIKPSISSGTTLLEALVFAQKKYHRHGVFVLLSDCIASDASAALTRLIIQEDACIILLEDPQERQFSYSGLLRMKDSETGQELDLAFAKKELALLLQARRDELATICTRYGGQILRLDLAALAAHSDAELVQTLITFFLRTMTRLLRN